MRHTIITNALIFVFFFFQAEDGIRDYKVTGVQTCALPIYLCPFVAWSPCGFLCVRHRRTRPVVCPYSDRKSTRLNSSHLVISYAVFCLKKNTRAIGRRPAAALQPRVRTDA